MCSEIRTLFDRNTFLPTFTDKIDLQIFPPRPNDDQSQKELAQLE